MSTSRGNGPETSAVDPIADGANSYDAVPYSVNAFPQTRPDRLAAIAALFGLEAPPPRRCRVLELACASGGNLIPLALSSPESTFVGVDLSQRQIADGQSVVGQLGLGNVELKPMSIIDVGREFGTFDYILAHGVYSWVPPEVQEQILEICGRNLSAQGVAYVSYNTLPGWHARGAIREMLWYHTERFTDPAERIREARQLLSFLAASAKQGDGGYGLLLRHELTVLARTPDTYLLHEHLEEFNEPLYFHQFAERAASKGLQYLGEAHVGAMMAAQFGAQAEQTLRQLSPDLLHMEQYMDFLRNRMFRQTLLCHDDVSLDYVLRPAAVKTFYIASPLRAAADDAAPSAKTEPPSSGGARLVTHDPLMKAAMGHLSKMWPLSVSFADLCSAARAQLGHSTSSPLPAGTSATTAASADVLAARLLNGHAAGWVEFSLGEPNFVIEVSERPLASPY
ncbi:MAG: methyltransferase regulatory domain-containing protein, partial [Pirellulales bacterium]